MAISRTYGHQNTQKSCAMMIVRKCPYSIQPSQFTSSCFTSHIAERYLLTGISKAGSLRLAKNLHSLEREPDQNILLPLIAQIFCVHKKPAWRNVIHENKILPFQSQNRTLQCPIPQVFNNQFCF